MEDGFIVKAHKQGEILIGAPMGKGPQSWAGGPRSRGGMKAIPEELKEDSPIGY